MSSTSHAGDAVERGAALASRDGGIEAALLDLDGVITRTAAVHERAWREALEPLGGGPFTHEDYLRYVDGRPRTEGARTFLAARRIDLPEGREGEAPSRRTIAGVAALKDALFNRLLDERGVHVFHDAVLAIDRFRREGLRLAVVSSSKNTRRVLEAARLSDAFEARVDGEIGAALGLAGKPAPDYFLEAARRLGVAPRSAMVIEDAASGVLAARRGGFGLVVGVSRDGNEARLHDAGADVVVHELTELDVRPAWLVTGGAS